MDTLTDLSRARLSALTLVILILLSSCAAPAAVAPVNGDVLATMPGTTIYGMKLAVSEAWETARLAKDGLILLGWPMNDGWGFICMDGTNTSCFKQMKDIFQGGNFTSAQSMSDLVKHLETNGWKAITAAEIPDVIKTALSTSENWMTTLAQSMTTFLVVPVFTLEGDFMLDIVSPAPEEL